MRLFRMLKFLSVEEKRHPLHFNCQPMSFTQNSPTSTEPNFKSSPESSNTSLLLPPPTTNSQRILNLVVNGQKMSRYRPASNLATSSTQRTPRNLRESSLSSFKGTFLNYLSSAGKKRVNKSKKNT